jgi:hypothetical protein
LALHHKIDQKQFSVLVISGGLKGGVDIKSYKKAKADRNGHHLSYCGLMQMSSYHYFSLRNLPGEEKRGKREKTTEELEALSNFQCMTLEMMITASN